MTDKNEGPCSDDLETEEDFILDTEDKADYSVEETNTKEMKA